MGKTDNQQWRKSIDEWLSEEDVERAAFERGHAAGFEDGYTEGYNAARMSQ